MYESSLSIKHYNRSHLFWGIDKETNEVVYIDEIKNRGLECNCRCAQCKGDFIARLGDINRHHFAHQSNYDCLYANEIAFYLRAKKWLTQNDVMQVPIVFFEFGNRKDRAVSEREMLIGSVFYECDSTQYPPLLVVETKKRPIRIILGFGSYYSKEDRDLLKEEAIQKGWDCLIINMPRISDRDPLPGGQFGDRIRMWTNSKEWLYCLDNDMTHRLRAQAPQRISYNPPNRTISKVGVSAIDSTPQKNTTSNLRGDRTVISGEFNPELPIEEDRFGRRWVQCRKCKELITTIQCYDFDRSRQTSYGICRTCAKKSEI